MLSNQIECSRFGSNNPPQFVLGTYPCGVTARKLNRQNFRNLCQFPFTLLRRSMSTGASNTIQNNPFVTVPGVYTIFKERHDPCGGLKIDWTARGTYRTDQVHNQPTLRLTLDSDDCRVEFLFRPQIYTLASRIREFNRTVHATSL